MSDLKGKLIYGVAFGGGEDKEWLLHESVRTEWGSLKLHLPWWNPIPEGVEFGSKQYWELPRPGDSFISACERRLHEAIPGGDPEDRYAPEASIKQHYGVEFFYHGTGNGLCYTLGTYQFEAEWGDHLEIDLDVLGNSEMRKIWNAHIEHALQVLGVRPLQKRPEWLLTALKFD